MTTPFSFVGPEISDGSSAVFPAESETLAGISFGPNGNDFNGNVVLPVSADVQAGVLFGPDSLIAGNFGVPAEAQVENGVQFGGNGNEFTGSLVVTGGSCDPAAIASQVAQTLTGPIQVVSPFHPVTQSLTLVRNADYVDAAAQGPLEIPVPTTFTVTAGDTVRFGAYLESENQRLAKAGTVVDKSGTLYARFQIPSSDFANVVASRAWKYEVQHETSGGHVSPMISDAELYLLESHADA